MRNLWKNTAAVDKVSCGSFSIMPTCIMKFMPLIRSSFSVSKVMPSRIEGVWDSSSSVKSHCASASARTASTGFGGRRLAGWMGMDCDMAGDSRSKCIQFRNVSMKGSGSPRLLFR